MNSKRRLVTPLEGAFDSANTKRKKKANSSMKAETYVDKSKKRTVCREQTPPERSNNALLRFIQCGTSMGSAAS